MDSFLHSFIHIQAYNLLTHGLGVETQTETEIMENLGFVRVYNSGNLRFTWAKNN